MNLFRPEYALSMGVAVALALLFPVTKHLRRDERKSYYTLQIITLFGRDTLTELRQSLIAAEAEVTGGAGLRVSPFADAVDGASLLQRAGFALPVTDVDRVTVRYSHPLKLMADLRAMGETNALSDRRPFLHRATLGRAAAIYAERFANSDGRIRATFEVLFLTGWAPHPDHAKPRPGLRRRIS